MNPQLTNKNKLCDITPSLEHKHKPDHKTTSNFFGRTISPKAITFSDQTQTDPSSYISFACDMFLTELFREAENGGDEEKY
jgi:hypothetical protein